MSIDDTSAVIPLSELNNPGASRAPGYEIAKPTVPAKAKRYRLEQQAYLNHRLCERGEIVLVAGDPAPYMKPVDDEVEEPSKTANRPKKEVTSKDVI